jgi:hypothetical protein
MVAQQVQAGGLGQRGPRWGSMFLSQASKAWLLGLV